MESQLPIKTSLYITAQKRRLEFIWRQFGLLEAGVGVGTFYSFSRQCRHPLMSHCSANCSAVSAPFDVTLLRKLQCSVRDLISHRTANCS